MKDQSNCPKCNSENIYLDGSLWMCPECFHEWSGAVVDEKTIESESGPRVISDANGNPLADGDSVIVIKDLKIKGASSVIKGGTKVRGIRLVDGVDGHDIACKVDGVGAIHLKSEFVKKA